MAASAQEMTVRSAVREWLQSFGGADLIATMHMPRLAQAKLASTGGGDDSAALSRQLMHCFNRLDRKIFGQGHRRCGQRVKRMVVLEFATTVGWHAHLLMQTPAEVGPINTGALLEKLWLKQFRGFLTKDFENRLF